MPVETHNLATCGTGSLQLCLAIWADNKPCRNSLTAFGTNRPDIPVDQGIDQHTQSARGHHKQSPEQGREPAPSGIQYDSQSRADK